MDAPTGSGRAAAWHAGRWLLSLALALAPLWVGPWHEAQRRAGPPPLELSIVRLPAAAASAPTPRQPPTAQPTAEPPPPLADAAPAAPLPGAVAALRPAPDAALATGQPPRSTPATTPPAATLSSTEPPTASPGMLQETAPQEAVPPSSEQPTHAEAANTTTEATGLPAVDAEALDAGFRLLSRGPLTYPSRARRLSRGGEVRVEVAVDPAGRVSGVMVLHETRGWGFGDAAREAYAQARFSPPTVNGRPVHVRWRKTLRFHP